MSMFNLKNIILKKYGKIKSKIVTKIIFTLSYFKINRSIRKIKSFHNKHVGQRCFIIGNGPSLKVEDLQMLKNEICFGSHRIYHIYDKTDWRPTYYCAQDRALINNSAKEIQNKIDNPKFIAIIPQVDASKIKNAIYVKINLENFYPELPKFSEDMSEGFYEGYTVTYMCFQMAIYMGFKEIVLLGVDHNYSVDILPDGTVRKQNIKDHFSTEDTITNPPKTFKSILAYISAKKYADSHGIKIYNATRGGKLDVFERVDLEKLF